MRELKEKNDVVDELKTNGAFRYGICMVILGIVLLGTLFPIFLEFENYQNVKKPLEAGGSPLAADMNLPLFLIPCSFLFMISGGLGIASYFKNNRILGYASLSLTIVASITSIICAAVLLSILNNLVDTLIGNPVENPDEFGDRETSVMDFTAAIYNECCFPVYNSLNYNFQGFTGPLLDDPQDVNSALDINQKPVLECVANDIEATCPTADDAINGIEQMFPDSVSIVLGELGGALGLLCHCISDAERFDAFVSSLQSEGSCDKFRAVRVGDVNDRQIPGVGFQYGQIPNSLRLIDLEEVAEESPTIDNIALVGKPISAASIYGEPAEDIGFSCGLGFAKSIALTLYFFVDDTTYPSTIGAFICGGIGILASLILIGFWFCEGGQVVDTGDEYADVEENAKVKDGKGKDKGKKDEYDEYDDVYE